MRTLRKNKNDFFDSKLEPYAITQFLSALFNVLCLMTNQQNGKTLLHLTFHNNFLNNEQIMNTATRRITGKNVKVAIAANVQLETDFS